jgi:hypothetical protein
MQPIDGYFLYDSGKQIQAVSGLTPQSTLGDAVIPLLIAEWALDALVRKSVFRLRTSRLDGENLLATIGRLRERAQKEDHKTSLGWPDHQALTDGLSRFEAVLAAELRASSLYLLTQKKGLDTAALIANGAVMFPDSLESKVPAAISGCTRSYALPRLRTPDRCWLPPSPSERKCPSQIP